MQFHLNEPLWRHCCFIGGSSIWRDVDKHFSLIVCEDLKNPFHSTTLIKLKMPDCSEVVINALGLFTNASSEATSKGCVGDIFDFEHNQASNIADNKQDCKYH